MARSVLLFSLLLCVSAVSRAGEVHKCVTPTGIAYQSAPCAGAELPTSVAISSATQTAPPLQANAATGTAARTTPSCDATPQRASPRLPWRHTLICIGMTDDEVLNLPGWGRPAAISRTRAAPPVARGMVLRRVARGRGATVAFRQRQAGRGGDRSRRAHRSAGEGRVELIWHPQAGARRRTRSSPRQMRPAPTMTVNPSTVHSSGTSPNMPYPRATAVMICR